VWGAGLEKSRGRQPADRVLVEFGYLNGREDAVGQVPQEGGGVPGSLLWSRPALRLGGQWLTNEDYRTGWQEDQLGGRWLSVEQFAGGLPDPDSDPESGRLVVVVLLG
jgi:hypothetical protein